MDGQTPFQKMLKTAVPDAYYHPQVGSNFPTRRYTFLLFRLSQTYEIMEANNESEESLARFLNTCKSWIQGLEFEAGKIETAVIMYMKQSNITCYNSQ
jgi:hypothetical protein